MPNLNSFTLHGLLKNLMQSFTKNFFLYSPVKKTTTKNSSVSQVTQTGMQIFCYLSK